jgi:hypothetical protein
MSLTTVFTVAAIVGLIRRIARAIEQVSAQPVVSMQRFAVRIALLVFAFIGTGLLCALACVPLLSMLLPLLVEGVDMRAAALGGMMFGKQNWAIAALQWGTAAAAAFFAVQMVFERRQGLGTAAANLVPVAACLGVALLLSDARSFHGADPAGSGVLPWSSIRTQPALQGVDVQCDHAALLVRKEGPDLVRYRCVDVERAMVLGRFSQHPLVFWPDYSEGVSMRLAAALQAIQTR